MVSFFYLFDGCNVTYFAFITVDYNSTVLSQDAHGIFLQSDSHRRRFFQEIYKPRRTFSGTDGSAESDADRYVRNGRDQNIWPWPRPHSLPPLPVVPSSNFHPTSHTSHTSHTSLHCNCRNDRSRRFEDSVVVTPNGVGQGAHECDGPNHHHRQLFLLLHHFTVFVFFTHFLIFFFTVLFSVVYFFPYLPDNIWIFWSNPSIYTSK